MNKRTRNNYINSPSPIEWELHALFKQTAPVIVFDIGSCEGEDSIRYSRLFPHGRILAFEPLPGNVERIKSQLAVYDAENVEVFQTALSDTVGEADFYVSSGQKDPGTADTDWDFGNKSSSLLPPHANSKELFPWLEFSEKIKVPINRLELFCASQGIHQVDLIHLDVQGAELKVLSGAGRFINHINAVWMEVEKIPLYEAQPLKQDIERFMHEHRFVKLKDTVSSLAGDQLYVNAVYLQKHPLAATRLSLRMLRNKIYQIVRS